jgi:hypothetical protein
MNIEQRLVDALRTVEATEPSPDLWSRVVHSIEEDRTHRRRVVGAAGAGAATIVGLMLIGILGSTDGPLGRYVRLPVMELIETLALVALVLVLGPAIRRFGRGYATDLWSATPTMAAALLRLLDVAYLLVSSGFIFLTVDFDFGSSTVQLAGQVQSGLNRVGGLIVVMGLLHAVTIIVLPAVALVSNSTRVGRSLPRWFVILLVIAGVMVGWQLIALIPILIAGAG